ADGLEPLRYTWEQVYSAAELDQVLTVDADSLGLGLLVHEMHVRDERIGGLLLGEPVRFCPERPRILADLGQEGVLLHRPRRESPIEIVDESDCLAVEAGARRRGCPPGPAGPSQRHVVIGRPALLSIQRSLRHRSCFPRATTLTASASRDS